MPTDKAGREHAFPPDRTGHVPEHTYGTDNVIRSAHIAETMVTLHFNVNSVKRTV